MTKKQAQLISNVVIRLIDKRAIEILEAEGLEVYYAELWDAIYNYYVKKDADRSL